MDFNDRNEGFEGGKDSGATAVWRIGGLKPSPGVFR